MNTKMVGAAAVILNDQKHVLLVKHSYGPLNWELPGGGAEAGESVVETALREVREETGLQVEAQETSGVYYDSETDSLHFVFLCKVAIGDDPRPDGEEILECAYWPVDKLPQPMYDFTFLRIQDAVTETHSSLPAVVPSRRILVEPNTSANDKN